MCRNEPLSPPTVQDEARLQLSEDLLTVWLRLSCAVNNHRLVKDLSFNEALVCHMLHLAQRDSRALTATDLCAATNILKSQMNVILLSLEKKGIISRCQSDRDRRRVEIRLLPEGCARYRESHTSTIALVGRLIDSLGEAEVHQLIPAIRNVVDAFNHLQQEE